MAFQYTKENLIRREKIIQRLFEIIPGLLSWMTLLGMLGLCILAPVSAAVIAIAFIFFWFMRLLYMTVFLILSYIRLNIEENTDWMSRIRGIEHLNQ